MRKLRLILPAALAVLMMIGFTAGTRATAIPVPSSGPITFISSRRFCYGIETTC